MPTLHSIRKAVPAYRVCNSIGKHSERWKSTYPPYIDPIKDAPHLTLMLAFHAGKDALP